MCCFPSFSPTLPILNRFKQTQSPWFEPGNILEHLMISESPSFLAGTMPSCFGNLELLGMCYTWLLKLLALVPQAIVIASRGMVRLVTSWVEETWKGSVQKWSLLWICSNFSLSDLQKRCPKACYVDISYHPLRVYCFPFSAKSTGLLRILQRTLSIFTGIFYTCCEEVSVVSWTTWRWPCCDLLGPWSPKQTTTLKVLHWMNRATRCRNGRVWFVQRILHILECLKKH